MLIGLTGQIGAGKSTAAAIIKKTGARVIDADRIGREVANNSAPLRKQLKRAFGPEIMNKNGRLKRKKLAAKAFASSANHAKLNALVHPYLLKELRRQMRAAEKRYRLVVIDAALLLDWHLDREMDFVLVIHTSLEKRLRRLIKRGITRKDAQARLKAQLPLSVFRKKADRFILNGNNEAELERKIKAWLSKILRQTD